ncbi:MAG: superoxide dismutase [Thermodesulfobacteriota bacterium]
MLNSCDISANKSLFTVEPLPYAETALEPYMSAETLQYHYGKHYPGYVEAANRLTRQSRFRGKSFEEVMAQTKDRPEDAEIFNQVGQAWNHAFFFKSLKPKGGGLPQGRLADKINHDFGSYEKFKSQFIAQAKAQFGSGWIWLVLDGEELKIVSTANGDTPAAHGLKPLFVVDVWEHAYYLDFRHRRSEFVEAILDHLANWDFVASQLEQGLPKIDS